MIKVTELMINDWVKLNGSNYQVQVIKKKGVIKLYENTKYGEHDIELNTDWIEEFVEPIPLTSEILEKNGYTPHDDLVGRVVEWCSEDNRIIMSDWEYDINSNNHWYIHIDNEDMDTICTAEITYVHELQHLLRLCKIEKEIVL